MGKRLMMDRVFFKTSISEQVREQALSVINNLGTYSFIDDTQSISHTDWHMSGFNQTMKLENKYLPVIEEEINKHYDYISDALNYEYNHGKSVLETVGMWFQQYKPGDYHSTHTHGTCALSSVIYLELEGQDQATEFFTKNNKFQVEVKQGDILTFPSFLAHGSPNIIETRKTIISFNTVVKDVCYE